MIVGCDSWCGLQDAPLRLKLGAVCLSVRFPVHVRLYRVPALRSLGSSGSISCHWARSSVALRWYVFPVSAVT